MSNALSSSDVQPEHATDVVQNLNLEGFTLVPVTIIGRVGWTPEEEWAYQAGYMRALNDYANSQLDEEE